MKEYRRRLRYLLPDVEIRLSFGEAVGIDHVHQHQVVAIDVAILLAKVIVGGQIVVLTKGARLPARHDRRVGCLEEGLHVVVVARGDVQVSIGPLEGTADVSQVSTAHVLAHHPVNVGQHDAQVMLVRRQCRVSIVGGECRLVGDHLVGGGHHHQHLSARPVEHKATQVGANGEDVIRGDGIAG